MAVEKLDTLLSQWRSLAPQRVEIEAIKTDPAYQPRELALIPYDARRRVEIESERHTEDLTVKLLDGRSLEPLLIARMDGALWLIDGHHRLNAYRNAGRDTVPARIMDSNRRTALIASKAANCDGVKLPMHIDQRREAAWQFLALVTRQGKQPLPPGHSLRGIGRTFGIGHDTAARMRRQMEKMKRDDYAPTACDPGTGYPLWKHVKGNAIRERLEDVPMDQREEHKIEKLAVTLGALREKNGGERFSAALRRIEVDISAATFETLALAPMSYAVAAPRQELEEDGDF